MFSVATRHFDIHIVFAFPISDYNLGMFKTPEVCIVLIRAVIKVA